MSNQLILAYDCACRGGSIALLHAGITTSARMTETREAAELIPAIDGLLKNRSVHYADISAIITTVGPGSFTGVRIGLAALHGFALANATPIKTLTTLAAMAWIVAAKQDAPEIFSIAILAGKGEAYTQKFQLSEAIPLPISDILLVPQQTMQWNAACFGNHTLAEDPHFIHGPDAAILCAIHEHIPETTLAAALPIYIRPPDAIVGTPYPWMVTN